MSRQSNQAPELNRADTGAMADAALSTLEGGHTHNTSPTRFVEVDAVRFAYRRFGNPVGTPIVLLQHFMGNLDNYDPAITEALATGREVILTDNAGVGLSTGAAPETVAGMARDAGSTRSRTRLTSRAPSSPPNSHPLHQPVPGPAGKVPPNWRQQLR